MMTASGAKKASGGPAAVELVDLCKIFGEGDNASYAVDTMNLKIRSGEFFTFLGPSGCGKTTTLRMIAGFEGPSRGSVILQGKDVSDNPPHKRNVNTVFQNYALFPHLTVEENVGFGLSVKRVPKAEIRDRVATALEQVRMGHVAGRKPSALSGGQQQRIALARAIVNEPSVLLLDEPFGALDLKLRREMQLEIKEMQRRLGITFIFVTHDQEEALTMSDRIAVMSAGIVRQVDNPTGIYERPKDRFTAGFIGEMNMIDATVSAADDDKITLATAGSTVTVPRGDQTLKTGDKATLAVRPEAFVPGSGPAGETVTFKGTSGEPVYVGSDYLIPLKFPGGDDLLVRMRNRVGHLDPPATGEPFAVSCPTAAIHILTE